MQKVTPTDDWEREFKRISHNPIYFIEHYWNKLHPENKPELTQEEKQSLYNEYRGLPYFSTWNKMERYQKKVDELKKQGYEDWEIIFG
jgi:hypothetical protein